MRAITRLGFGALAAAAIAAPATAAGDAVTAMCLAQESQAVCDCSSEALRAAIGEEDYAVYEAVGASYLSLMEQGQPRGDAWMAALNETGAELDRTNAWGRAHRDAMDACGG